MKTALVLLALAVYSVLCFDALYSSKPVVDIATGAGQLAHLVLNADSTIAYFTEVHKIWALDLVTLTKTHIGGTGASGTTGDEGPATAATFSSPYSLALDKTNNKLYVGQTGGSYQAIRVIDLNTGLVHLAAGGGSNSGEGVTALDAQLGAITALYFDNASNKLYMGTSGGTTRIRVLDFGTGLITSIAGTGADSTSTNGAIAISSTVASPRALALVGTKLYISEAPACVVSYVDFTDGKIYRLAGTGVEGTSGDGGPALSAQMRHPTGLAYVPASNRLYIADYLISSVRYVDLTTNIIEYVGGGENGDLSSGAIFSSSRGANPTGLAIDTVSNTLYFAEASISRVRRVGDGPTCSSFDTTKYGARKPVVTATASGSTVTVAVTMYRQTLDNSGTPVFHNIDTKDLGSNVCRTTNNNVVASAGQNWVKTSNQCSDTYTLTQSLTQIVDTGAANNNWVSNLAADGRSITYNVPIYGTYSVNNGQGDCYYVGYRSQVSFRTQLNIASTSSSFTTADKSAVFQFSGLRMTSTNELEISGSITPLVPDSQLKNIALKKVAGNIAIPSVTSNDCNTYNVACSQVYRVGIATLGGANTDISGSYDTTMDVYEGGVKTRDATLSYQIAYIIPSDPTVVDSDTIMTENKLYTANDYATVRTSSYSSTSNANDILFIQNGITDASPAIPAGYKLRMVKGYLCCVAYATGISAYNPSQDSGGCRDSANKLEWVDLGSESSHPAAVAYTSADVVGAKKYRLEVTLNTAYNAQNIPHAAPMTCQVLLISKLEAPAARRIGGASNIASTFVSTSSFSVQANTVASNASIMSISALVVLIVLSFVL